MGSWVTVPSFTTNHIARAETFQDIWSNLYLLKNPMFVINRTIGDNSTTSSFSSGTFADIDATNYQLNFTSYGNAVLFAATVRIRHSASSGQGFFRFMIDGTAYGNAGGLAQWQATLAQVLGEVFCFTYLWESATAGSHTASVQVATSGATLSVDMYPNTYFLAMEF